MYQRFLSEKKRNSFCVDHLLVIFIYFRKIRGEIIFTVLIYLCNVYIIKAQPVWVRDIYFEAHGSNPVVTIENS